MVTNVTDTLEIISIKTDWTPSLYRELIDLGRTNCATFGLVTGNWRHHNDPEVLNTLKPYLVESVITKMWPGTQSLSDETICFQKFHLNQKSAAILKTCVSKLWDWSAPDFPEDLSFLRPDGRPYFVSIIHERDAYFKISKKQRVAIEALFGSDAIQSDGEDSMPNERF